jgi:hypothetical protein
LVSTLGARWLAGANNAHGVFATRNELRLARFQISGDDVSVSKGVLLEKLRCPDYAELRVLARQRAKLRARSRHVEGSKAKRLAVQLSALDLQFKRYRRFCRRGISAAIDDCAGWAVTAALSKLTFWRRRGARMKRVRSVAGGPYRALTLHLRPRRR